MALLVIKDADVNSLVPLYAIGVFTAFTMAGLRHGQVPPAGTGAGLAAQG